MRVVKLITLLSLLCPVPGAFAAGKEHVLYSFTGGRDGEHPIAGVISDKAGNLYGTASEGGNDSTGCYGRGCGTVFELQRTQTGWKRIVLHAFTGTLQGGGDGALPLAGLVMDKAGNLYGTTISGGRTGAGVAFELEHTAKGWKEIILYSFGNGADGGYPECSLIFDRSGNLYGIAQGGGSNYSGIIFELSPSKGHWKESVLYNFAANTEPEEAPLIFDSKGNLYGTTPGGGDTGYPCQWSSCGTVFELAHRKTRWAYQLLYAFTGGNDGALPRGGLSFDKAGNLYGTTSAGDGSELGVVFELSPSNNGWTESVVHGFTLGDGAAPVGNLIFDHAGNLWSTTSEGGSGGCIYPGCGVVFELKPKNGEWEYDQVHNFTGPDGNDPFAGLVSDSTGNLYGTTYIGGNSNAGAVFEIVP